MKKNIAAILIFVFTFQIATPALAQESQNDRVNNLSKCYEEVFTKATNSFARYTGEKPTPLTSEKKLEYLKNATYLFALKTKSGEESSVSAKPIAYGFAAILIASGIVSGYISYKSYTKFSAARKYMQLIKEESTSLEKLNSLAKKMGKIGTVGENEVHILAKTKVAVFGWVVPLTFTALGTLCFFAASYGTFSERYSLDTLEDLFNAQSIHDFFVTLNSDGKTAVAITNGLQEGCTQMKNEVSLTKAFDDLNSITDEDVKAVQVWINTDKK